MKDQDALECIRLRHAYIEKGRGREQHWVICCRRPGGPWEAWGGSETKEDAERIRDGMLERRPGLRDLQWSLVGPGGA